ncbi:MAG: IS1595 family transposase [Hyphomicrobiales bacterium]
MASVLCEAYFQDEAAAFERLEQIVWPNGPVCPHCGGMGRIGSLAGVKDKKGRVRLGLRKCYDCRSQFTVRVKTVFEKSHIPLHLWFQAAHLLMSSKKGISSNQLHRTLGVTLQTAWFMSHRLREALRVIGGDPMGGAGKVVESDETYIGMKEGYRKPKSGTGHKNMVMTLVERGGEARSFNVESATRSTVERIMFGNIAKETAVMTDEAPHYQGPGREFASHETVNHGEKEYVRGHVTTNTVEGYYSIFKRGMIGVYQHCSERHLHRYPAEFDFRYSNRVKLGVHDVMRTNRAMVGIKGKRLLYRDSSTL